MVEKKSDKELVFSGANYVLEHFKPLIFLSIHPKLMKNHNSSAERLLDSIRQKNYELFDSNGNIPQIITNNEYVVKSKI